MRKEQQVETVSFKVGGMCSCEGPMVEKRLQKLKGIESFSLNLIMNQLKVVYDPAVVSIEEIERAAAKAGAKTTRI
jgi:copper chaperone CopZ